MPDTETESNVPFEPDSSKNVRHQNPPSPDPVSASEIFADTEELKKLIGELYSQIMERYPVADGKVPFVLIGIHRSGVPLAERLAKLIEERTGARPETGMLDITMYRDDIGMRKGLPHIYETQIPAIDRRVVIFVDGIIQSGRSIRAALDAVNYFGRPSAVRLATIYDRGNRELPIRPDFVARNISVPGDKRVSFEWNEFSGKSDSVLLTSKIKVS